MQLAIVVLSVVSAVTAVIGVLGYLLDRSVTNHERSEGR
jgi:hypothetical protein